MSDHDYCRPGVDKGKEEVSSFVHGIEEDILEEIRQQKEATRRKEEEARSIPSYLAKEWIPLGPEFLEEARLLQAVQFDQRHVALVALIIRALEANPDPRMYWPLTAWERARGRKEGLDIPTPVDSDDGSPDASTTTMPPPSHQGEFEEPPPPLGRLMIADVSDHEREAEDDEAGAQDWLDCDLGIGETVRTPSPVKIDHEEGGAPERVEHPEVLEPPARRDWRDDWRTHSAHPGWLPVNDSAPSPVVQEPEPKPWTGRAWRPLPRKRGFSPLPPTPSDNQASTSGEKAPIRKGLRGTNGLLMKTSGVMFNDVALIDTDRSLDPPPRSCYNCWGTKHASRNCPNPPTTTPYCRNCGRRGVLLDDCPRCGRARARWHQVWTPEEKAAPQRPPTQRRDHEEERGRLGHPPLTRRTPATTETTSAEAAPLHGSGPSHVAEFGRRVSLPSNSGQEYLEGSFGTRGERDRGATPTTKPIAWTTGRPGSET